MPIAPCIIVYQFGGRDILRTETRVRVGVRFHFGITFCRLTRAVKGMAMQPRTRRVGCAACTQLDTDYLFKPCTFKHATTSTGAGAGAGAGATSVGTKRRRTSMTLIAHPPKSSSTGRTPPHPPTPAFLHAHTPAHAPLLLPHAAPSECNITHTF